MTPDIHTLQHDKMFIDTHMCSKTTVNVNTQDFVNTQALTYSNPKPSAFMMASFNLSVSFSLLLYDGNSRVLKQV